MHYFSGLFDAEGYVSLLKTGNYLIGTEMANEEIPNLFQETFGGSIYTRKRENRKKTFTWTIGTNREQALNFIENVFPCCIVKKTQLLRLRDYLLLSRKERSELRNIVRAQLSNLKKPFQASKDVFNTFEDPEIPTDEFFFQWFAGFVDGDGNFSLYETKKGKWTAFQSWFGVFNVDFIPINHVKQRLKGCISNYHQSKNVVWKWVCSQNIEQSVCKSLLPFLKIKKKACEIILCYHEIKKTKNKFVSYSNEDRDKIRDLIKQIKHINSL